MEYVREIVVYASDTTFSVFQEEIRRTGWTSDIRRVHEIQDITTAIEEGSGVAFVVEVSPSECEDGYRVLRSAKRHFSGFRRPAVILVGSRPSEAIQAFELDAFDYLLSPVDREKVKNSVGRMTDHILNDHLEAINVRLQRVMDSVMNQDPQRGRARVRGSQRPVERFGVRVGDRYMMIKVDDIQCVSGAGVYVELWTGGQSYLLRASITEIETKLDPDRFFRIHRSTIVNMDMVCEILQHGKGSYIVVLTDGSRLKVSRSYGEKVRDYMNAVG
jgi:two-component system, LytTR family, response regulator